MTGEIHGSLVLKARMPAEAGALLVKALDAAMAESPTPQRVVKKYSDFVPEFCPIDEPSYEARRADALGLMAESFMQHDAEAMSGGDRHQVIIHVSAETSRAREVPEIDDGSSLYKEMMARIRQKYAANGEDYL